MRNIECTATKQDMVNIIIDELKTVSTRVSFYDSISFGVIVNDKEVIFHSIEYDVNDNNVYLIDYDDNRYNVMEWVCDDEIEFLTDCVKEDCETYRVCEKIRSIGKCIRFKKPVMLDVCEDEGICGVDKMEFIDNCLYLFCGCNIYYAKEWLSYISDWLTLKLEVDDCENIEVSDVNSDVMYAVSAKVYDEQFDEFVADAIVSKFYTDINRAIAEKERIEKLSDTEKRKLFPRNHTIGAGKCVGLDIVVYELVK